MSAPMNSSTVENISLFIPHVYPNLTQEFIAGVFEKLALGKVDHIDLVSKIDRKGKPYNSAYIYFVCWNSGNAMQDFQNLVKDPRKEARIKYDRSRYWVVLQNTRKKYTKSRIDLLDRSHDDIQFMEISPGISEVILSPKIIEEFNIMFAKHGVKI